jgi:outer membrane protein TolC
VAGVSVTIPIPGRYRNQRFAQALDTAHMAEAARDRQQRELEMEIAEAYTDATSNYERWRLAEEAAAKTGENAQLTQRAYALGEADLQTLLLARRQSLEAAQSALEARVVALRSYYGILVDAHRIWGLAHE